MMPSDARSKGRIHWRRRFIAGQGNGLCFPNRCQSGDRCSLIASARRRRKQKSIIHRRADHKNGLKLKACRFREDIQTSKTNVQHRCVGGRIRDDPIEILHSRVTRLCEPHVGRPAAIERKENFRLTHCQVHVWKLRRPCNPHNLSRSQNLSRSWRNQFGAVSWFVRLRGCAFRQLWSPSNCSASSATMNRGVFMFSLHPSERQLSITVCAATTLLIDLFVAPAWRQDLRIQNKARHSFGNR